MNDIQEKLFLFFSLTFSIFLFIIYKDPPSNESQWRLALQNVNIDNVHKIEVSTQDETFTLSKDKSTWYVKTDEKKIADKQTVARVLTILKQVQCTDDIKNDNEEYGLNNPKLTLRIADSFSFTVGDPTPTNEGDYISIDGKKCRTRTNISKRIALGSKEYYSKEILLISTSTIESIKLSNGVIIEKTSGNWKQRVPFTVALSHTKIDLWLASILEEQVLEFLDDKPKISGKSLVIKSREEQIQFEWSNDGKIISTHHNNGFIGTNKLIELLNVNSITFYEPMLLPNEFQSKQITHAEYVNSQGEEMIIEPDSIFWQLVSQPVFARIQGEYAHGNEELILYFEDDTKIRFSCTRVQEKILLSSPLEDLFISVPLDFLPEQD